MAGDNAVRCRISFSDRRDCATSASTDSTSTGSGNTGSTSTGSGNTGSGNTASQLRAITRLQQVHGCAVVRVSLPGEHCGAPADAAWTTVPGAALAIRTADCVPIALYGTATNGTSGTSASGTTASDSGTVGAAVAAVHAGWKGLLAGVIQATAAEMTSAGVSHLRAIIGPHIHANQYEFGSKELAELVERYGPSVAARTSQGAPAADLGAATRAALNEARIQLDYDLHSCTALQSDRYFSHRSRAETERMTMLIELGLVEIGLAKLA